MALLAPEALRQRRWGLGGCCAVRGRDIRANQSWVFECPTAGLCGQYANLLRPDLAPRLKRLLAGGGDGPSGASD